MAQNLSSASCSSSAVRPLQLELKRIQKEPVEGFRVRLPDDSNIFLWEVAIFGPPETLYEGGYFKVILRGFVSTRYNYFSGLSARWRRFVLAH